MAGKHKKEDTLSSLTEQLTDRYARWEHILEHGAGDPGWPDGVNINLVRNHILYCKRKIQEFMERENQEVTLFGSSYPDIYYRETPPEMPQNFMAHPERIRARAKEQLALYEQKPDFCFVRDPYKEAFPHGETKATRAANMYFGKFYRFEWYRKYVEQDDLMAMRRFACPYEDAAAFFAETASQLREYLARDHTKDDHAAAPDFFEDDEYSDCCDTESAPEIEEIEVETELPEKPISKDMIKPSLNSVIQNAQLKTKSKSVPEINREEQLSFF